MSMYKCLKTPLFILHHQQSLIHIFCPQKFFETDHRYYPECSTYSQVSSTTGNIMSPDTGHPPPGSGHSTPSRGHTPLLLSLSQLQGSGGLVILNSSSGRDYITRIIKTVFVLCVNRLSLCPKPLLCKVSFHNFHEAI